jgi:hypothetical protein
MHRLPTPILVPQRHGSDDSRNQGIQRGAEGDLQQKAARTKTSMGANLALDGSAEMSDDSRDRLIRLESNMTHMERQISDMQAKVNAMHDLLMQARGMRLLIVGMAAFSGFLTALATKYLPGFR